MVPTFSPASVLTGRRPVGRLQKDLMPGSDYTAETFNQEVEAVLVGIENPLRRPVTEAELGDMRYSLRSLLSRWRSLAPGSFLELSFLPIFAGPVIQER
jgi:hypothetical protein